MLSVDSRCEEEVLDDWNDLDLAQIKEQFIEFLLAGAIENQIGTEDKDSSG